MDCTMFFFVFSIHSSRREEATENNSVGAGLYIGVSNSCPA